MTKTLIDLDDELLAQTRQVLGTTTKKATLHEAMRDVVRRWAVQEFGHLARTGIFAGLSPMAPDNQLAHPPAKPEEQVCP
jgi:Arc/MetJ family transcription regulator